MSSGKRASSASSCPTWDITENKKDVHAGLVCDRRSECGRVQPLKERDAGVNDADSLVLALCLQQRGKASLIGVDRSHWRCL